MITYNYFDNDFFYIYSAQTINKTYILNATSILIPIYTNLQIPQFNITNNTWNIVEDHRQKYINNILIESSGTPYWLPEDSYNSEPRYMETPGPLPENALLEKPTIPLDILKNEKLNEIKKSFKLEEDIGFIESSLGFKADATRISNADINGLIQYMTNNAIEKTYFRDYNNIMHELSLTDLKILQNQIIEKGLWNYSHKWELESQISSHEDIKSLNNIKW